MEKFVEALVFGERLKDLRLENNLSALKLSKELGVDDATIGRWEKGIMVPNIIHLYRIAVYFGVSADYLIGLED
ncbi:MAG: helix-turn-helix transcriptional regulator [Clostridia bacterium]|nr:helix-turn-helix transcriptional regulator [Clostridia bacterium]